MLRKVACRLIYFFGLFLVDVCVLRTYRLHTTYFVVLLCSLSRVARRPTGLTRVRIIPLKIRKRANLWDSLLITGRTFWLSLCGIAPYFVISRPIIRGSLTYFLARFCHPCMKLCLVALLLANPETCTVAHQIADVTFLFLSPLLFLPSASVESLPLGIIPCTTDPHSVTIAYCERSEAHPVAPLPLSPCPRSQGSRRGWDDVRVM